jgi:hypothetical protein
MDLRVVAMEGESQPLFHLTFCRSNDWGE